MRLFLLFAWCGLASLLVNGYTANAQGVQIIPDLKSKKVEVWMDGELFTSYRFTDDVSRPSFWSVPGKNSAQTPADPQKIFKPMEMHNRPVIYTLKEPKIPEQTRVHTSLDSYRSGESQGEMTVTSEWKNSEGKTVATEKTTYIFERKEGARFVNRKTTLYAGKDTIRFENAEPAPDPPKWMSFKEKNGLDSARFTLFHHPENARNTGKNQVLLRNADSHPESIHLFIPPGKSINFTHRIVVWTGEIPNHEIILKYYEDWVEKGKLQHLKSD